MKRMNLEKCPCSGKTLARLMRPAVMGVLATEEQSIHGYQILQRLRKMKAFKNQPPDQTGVYKLLKIMEGEGVLASQWEITDSGPPKRRYSLTIQGRECLQRWLATLKKYEQMIDGIIALIASSCGREVDREKGKDCCA